MRLTIIALGSRGDVQPFVALGLGLREAGHEVRIAATSDYEPLVTPYGLEFAPVGGSINELMDREMVYSILDAPGNPINFARRFLGEVKPLVRKLVADCYEACRGAGALVASTLGVYAAYDVAREMGIPFYPAHMHPYGVTGAYPHVFCPTLPGRFPLRRQYNRLTHGISEAAFWLLLSGALSEARKEVLGLPPLLVREIARRVREQHSPVLLAYSKLLAPRPRDWGRHVHVTGYWFLDRPTGWQPPPGLAQFLEAGSPPVYVGFGSALVGRDPDGVTRMVVRALARAGQRGILTSAWGDLGNIDLPDCVYKAGPVPHDWLFPQMSAVVHHGGAGTTASALRAGVSSVIVPFFGDMRMWARRVQALGAATAPIPRQELSEARLAAAIEQAVSDGRMRTRAAALGERLVREKGVEQAIRALPLKGASLAVA